MAEISWTRRSYEAAVLLVPLDADAQTWVNGHIDDAMDGISVAGASVLRAQQRFAPAPVPATGEGRAVSSPLERAMHEADVVVLLTLNLGAIDGEVLAQIGDAARLAGKLLGAVVVSPGARWDEPAAHRSASAIRESADNVVILKDDRFVLAFIEVLRGGTREGSRDAHLAEVRP